MEKMARKNSKPNPRKGDFLLYSGRYILIDCVFLLYSYIKKLVYYVQVACSASAVCSWAFIIYYFISYMIFSDTTDTLGGALIAIGQGLAHILPSIIIAIVVFILGLFVASIIGRLITELSQLAKIDALFTKSGLRAALKKGGVSMNASEFIGGSVKWIVLLAFLVTALEIVGLTQVTLFLTNILSYVPQLISAALIVIATAVAAEFLKKTVITSTHAAGFSGAELAGKLVKATVWVFGAVVALQELGLPTSLFQILITGIIAAISLAFGLAFGLGGRDVAAKMLEKTYTDMHK
jgi:small-conductance mechanosensitive channel